MVLRFVLWRLLGALAVLVGALALAWMLDGGPGRALRGRPGARAASVLGAPLDGPGRLLSGAWRWAPAPGLAPTKLALVVLALAALAVVLTRVHARHARVYVRLRVDAYRGDQAGADSIARMLTAMHRCLAARWWVRCVRGQPSLSLEVHCDHDPRPEAWLAVTCPRGFERAVEGVLRAAYPSVSLRPSGRRVAGGPTVLRLGKRSEFIRRAKSVEAFERSRELPIDRLLTVMAACREPALVQLALTPAPASFEGLAKRIYRHREAQLSRRRREHLLMRDRSLVEDAELRGGLDVQHQPLYFVDLRLAAASHGTCERVAAELCAEVAENRLVERGTAVSHGIFGLYGRRLRRGEGNPLPSLRTAAFAPAELACMWHLPSVDYLAVPFQRGALPRVPAPPAIHRPDDGSGTLEDALGPVSIEVELRRQNTAVPGTVEQGKSSYLVATVAEDLRREHCAVVLLDPKGDAADAAVSLVPESRACTLLDLAHPTCGFNPLAVDAPADVIADYVVAALKLLFSDADIRASSDRYLRNAIIAVLAYDRRSTLWDAARLLSVGQEGYAYRRAVAAAVRALPEFKEISQFFAEELTAQLADSRATTTAKLDAPVNKLARLLNSPSIKRVLLNDSLTVDFDRVISRCEVLVVKGALGSMGAGNTSVVMQLLLGMLDAALARQQDLVAGDRRVAVALKVDEAPLVINRGFAETMALKRSAGLETVACWQSDAQWLDREVREQLDALFAHRVYFATASTRDARSAATLTMSEFSDTVRPGIERLSALGRPDVRLHLPKHHAVASWTTRAGRQPPFVARTIPMHVHRPRLDHHAAAQRARGGRHLADLRQPHWEERATVVPRPPAVPAASYRELLEVDRAHSLRRTQRRAVAPVQPERADLEVLALVAAMRHVLTSQLHRRFNPRRAPSTTQRRLKRLADAGLIERVQFHRTDGGGVPMCCAVTADGLRALLAAGHGQPALWEMLLEDRAATAARDAVTLDAAGLRALRRELHVAGWTLALARLLAGERHEARLVALRGPRESAISPPARAGARQGAPLGPDDLRLPGGRVPHDFTRSDVSGRPQPIDRVDTVRPGAIVEVAHGQEGRVDLLVDFDDRAPRAGAVDKLERYDHFLAGWSAHTRRYGARARATPWLVLVCRDHPCARAWASRADAVLRAARAYAGEYPFEWRHPGRERMLFVAERDLHEGLIAAYGVPPLPPAVRDAAVQSGPRAAETSILRRELPVAATPTGV